MWPRYGSSSGWHSASWPVEPAPRAASNDGQAAGFVVTPVQESENPRVSDADRFKDLNDLYGHAVGDTVLAAIGHRLTEWAGPRRVAGRLGGDEFAALTRIEHRHQALRLEHLNRQMTAPSPTATASCPWPCPWVPRHWPRPAPATCPP
ncbi:diguanylate cyclase [Streptomyces anulatus]|uniref:diguanylate cyclase domain-containing protein n=1 Tax=Streptomyces anulatus TaxID=1892 RepID=UPI0033FFA2C2|nr:diguanylate cyclase [Streptomyces anulatus]